MSDVDRTQKAMNIGVFSLAIKELWKIFFFVAFISWSTYFNGYFKMFW